jgi:type I restriction enzyme M protein
MSNVSNIVKTIQDIMRKDAGTYGDAQRLEQLGWMFFLYQEQTEEQHQEMLCHLTDPTIEDLKALSRRGS